jgi:hypothetical protein
MKAYGSGCIDPHFLGLGTRWRWMVNFTPRPLYPRGKSPRYPLDRRLGGPQSRSGRLKKMINIEKRKYRRKVRSMKGEIRMKKGNRNVKRIEMNKESKTETKCSVSLLWESMSRVGTLMTDALVMTKLSPCGLQTLMAGLPHLIPTTRPLCNTSATNGPYRKHNCKGPRS